jgi:polar amino acid transport system substrate-binding protein
MSRKMSGKVLSLMLAIVLIAMSLGGCGNQSTNATTNQPTTSLLDQIVKKGVITVGVFSDVPPLGFMDNKNELTGIDVDVAKAIATALNVKIVFVPTTNANRIPYLLTKKVDIIVAAFSMNSDRRKVVEFSDPYFRGGSTLIINTKDPKTANVKTLTDLKGENIAVAKGSLNDEIATKIAGGSNSIIRFDNVSDVYQALKDGKADAICEDEVLAGYNIKNLYPEMKTVGDLLSVDATGIGVRRGDQIFLNWLNGFVFDLLSSGQMKEICQKYGVTYNPVNFVY